MRCLVTGGCGFIGSHLVDALVQEGHEVRVFDNLTTGNMDNLEASRNSVEFAFGDVISTLAVTEAVRGMDIIFHLAALPSVARSIKSPGFTHETNATGTLNVLRAARAHGVNRVVYSSSSSAYGDSGSLKKKEVHATRPISPYAVSKLAGENYCMAFNEVYGMSNIALRYFNVYGPRQSATSQYAAVIPKFMELMQNGERPVIYGDGLQTRSFTYVADVVQANIHAALAKEFLKGVYNVAPPAFSSLNELVLLLNNVLDTKLLPIYTEARAGDIRHSIADVSRIDKVLHCVPKIWLREGLQLMLEGMDNG